MHISLHIVPGRVPVQGRRRGSVALRLAFSQSGIGLPRRVLRRIVASDTRGGLDLDPGKPSVSVSEDG